MVEALDKEAKASEQGGAQDLIGENIVCFAKDWSEDPTSNNHVMGLLAEKNKVLWLNSIGARSPKISSKRDMGKIAHKLRSFFQGPKQVKENFWVYTPIVLPFPHSRFASAVNRAILKVTIGVLRRQLKMQRFQLWSFHPNVAEYVGTLGEWVSVYYCTDNYANYVGVDTERMIEKERALCKKADIVFATSNALTHERKGLNPEVHLASHGVNYELFARALEDETPLPPDIASLSRPILGFYGLIEEWMDQDLVAYLAERHPEWSIALVGRVATDVSKLKAYPNIHFLGRKNHDELPGYCKAFSVALIPHQINDLTWHMNPMKLREYLSAGLPIVSVDLPEVRYYPNGCALARTYEEFESAVETALATDTRELRRQRSEPMTSETWEIKVRELGRKVMRVKAQNENRDST
jgi:glycosyltransferase involved in cell wall biosynthesis